MRNEGITGNRKSAQNPHPFRFKPAAAVVSARRAGTTAALDQMNKYFFHQQIGKTSVRLAIDKGNPQSSHFWKKNGFEVIAEADLDSVKIFSQIQF